MRAESWRVWALVSCLGGSGLLFGCAGDKGDKGETGAQGAQGAQGPQGDKGDPGDPGAKGDKGDKGDTGDTGAQGDKGDPGAPGGTVILSEKARLGLSISPVPVDTAGLSGDAIESVGRGAYLINAVADCQGCHSGQAGFLSGNNDFPIGPFDDGHGNTLDGHVFSRNLTPDAATGLKLSEAEFVDALRRGIDHKDATGGTTLIVMPWAQTRWMTTRDLKDIYAYLKHIPAVSNAVQADVKPIIPPAAYGPSPFADAVPTFGDGDVERPLPAAFDGAAGHPTADAAEAFDANQVLRGLAISPLADDEIVAGSLTPDEIAAYGRGSYIVNGPGLCNECHTLGGRDPATLKVRTDRFLAGGQAFGVPPPLQPLLGQVRSMSGNIAGEDFGFRDSFAVFVETLVTGMSFTNHDMGPHVLGFPMPADVYRNMTIEDKEAVYTYLWIIQDFGLVPNDSPHQMPARYCATVDDCEAGESCAAVTVGGAPTHECAGGACGSDADCGACQTCDNGTHKCVAEAADSQCVLTSL